MALCPGITYEPGLQKTGAVATERKRPGERPIIGSMSNAGFGAKPFREPFRLDPP